MISIVDRRFPADRYTAITLAMVNPDKRKGRHAVITFVRKVMRQPDLSAFFDVADEQDMKIVENHLGL